MSWSKDWLRPLLGGRSVSLTTGIACLCATVALLSSGLVLFGGFIEQRHDEKAETARFEEVASTSWAYALEAWERRARELVQAGVYRDGVIESLRERDRDGLYSALGTFFNYSRSGAMVDDWRICDADGICYASLANSITSDEPEQTVLRGEPVTSYTRAELLMEHGLPELVIPVRDEDASILAWFHLYPPRDALLAELELMTSHPIVEITGGEVFKSPGASDAWAQTLYDARGTECRINEVNGRLIRCVSIRADADSQLVVGFDVTDAVADRHFIASRMIGGIAFIVIGIITLGVLLVHVLIRPIREITDAIEQSEDASDVDLPPAVSTGARETVALSQVLRKWSLVARAHMTEVTRARDAAEIASQAKSDFLANMSHEIRTPMTAILGYTDLLAEDGDIKQAPETRRETIATIRRNGQHLLTLINDILDMSKIEAGRMSVEQIPTSPSQLVQDVASLMRPKAMEKDLELKVEYRSEIPRQIISDPTRLRQIIVNLVGNALKFTEQGSVTIAVELLRDAEADMLQFRVVDTGIGMSPEQVQVLSRFEAFSQADGSTTRRFGGTGLGLRISNSFTELLGGALTITSEEGVGSQFTATVRTGSLAGVQMLDPETAAAAVQDQQALAEAPADATDAPPLEGLRILLAEDGPDNQRLISFHLSKSGAEVTIADNGQVAIDEVRAATQPFDVILMDMQMPVLDGYSAAGKLRDMGNLTPVIALTAHAMTGDRQKCLDAGCNDYLTKPIDRKKLISVCRMWAATRIQSDAA